MSRTLTASDRNALIRLASELPKGSRERRAILVGLQKVSSRSTAMSNAPTKTASYNFPLGTVLAIIYENGDTEMVVSAGGDKVTRAENIPYLDHPKFKDRDIALPIENHSRKKIKDVQVVIPGRGRFLSDNHMIRAFLKWRSEFKRSDAQSLR